MTHASYRLIIFITLSAITYAPYTIAGTACKFCGNNVVSMGDFDKEIISKAPEICVSCHPDRTRKPEHVINVKVANPVLTSLPLHNGMVTCVTCHDPFSTAKHLLRSDKKTLCTACHGDKYTAQAR